MGKTVKQIADEIGVSKTAVRKYMDEAFKAKYTKQDGDRAPVIISDEGVEILKSKCKGKNPVNQFAETAETKVETPVNQAETDLISVLQEQMKALNKQLEIKDQQIHELTEANRNLTDALKGAQALHAADSKLLLEAKIKRSFWDIFRKKPSTKTQEQPEIKEVE